ncbi:histidine kinase/DNA gyrase B/HSP90-like ATPase [Malaciobacter marinus]|uniref:histidine kinase n=2 Tax=Malaciobacter marinus TaxID=505249 RepID=A0AB37A0U1_9BACT|nr:histidine kinase/DNA gyrase B/HSP90-like ATPase [Malaciobacter marinus]
MFNLMIRILILNLFFFINLHAQNLKEQMLEKTFISFDGKNFIKFKQLDKKNYEQKYTNLVLKIEIDEKLLKNDVYYIKILSTKDSFKNSNYSYEFINKVPIIKLENIKNDLIINFDLENQHLFFDLELFNEFEYKNILNEEKLLFGITYGIILCAFLYNFVFFLYNKEKIFLYYSLLQVSLLFLLVLCSKNSYIINLLDNNGNNIDISLTLLLNLSILLSILFNMEFLNTKKYTPKIHTSLWLLIFLDLLDIFSLLITNKSFIIDYIPPYILIFLLLIFAFFVLKQGYKPALFYIIGWFSLFIFVFLSQSSFSDYNENYMLHIGIPLESLLFSFAIGFKMRQTELEKQQNETILINKSKLASMGEMIGNIAHQWRQPLTHLSYIIMNLKAAYENDKLDKKYLEKKTDEANKQIEFMSHTIDDFRNFFKISKQKEEFSLIECINESINLLNESFKSLDIKLNFNYTENFRIRTYKGEFAQVIFNLLNNAKDEFIKQEIKDAKIIINIIKKEENILIEIIDNAGGISEKIIKKIFEPYFTTKEKGLGIGLYMSKVIIEKNIGGKLEVKNTMNGAKFIILLSNY